MATTLKTPGVYVEEITKFPPSVAQVETAVPAFIGYTQQAVVDGEDFHAEEIIKPVKVSSLPDFEFLFGGAPDPSDVEIDFHDDLTIKSAKVNSLNLLYDSLRMFYANGGGVCYIVSVGAYRSEKDEVNKEDFIKGLASLEKVDQPTLLVVPESVHLSYAEAGEVHASMLAQCNKLQDRFAVMDIVDGDKEISTSLDPVQEFRNHVGMNYLKYGAAYYPWIKTTLPFAINYEAVINGSYTQEGEEIEDITSLMNSGLVAGIDNIQNDIESAEVLEKPEDISVSNRADLSGYAADIFDYMAAFYNLSPADGDLDDPSSAASIHARFLAKKSNFHGLLKALYDYNHFSDHDNNNGNVPNSWGDPLVDTSSYDFGDLEPDSLPTSDSNNIYTSTGTATAAAPNFKGIASKLANLIRQYVQELESTKVKKTDNLLDVDPVYKSIVNAIKKKGVILPPSGAVVGIYSAVDGDRGVWKAPANVSITAVKGPSVNITHEEQESMNVDVDAGKSVNAIRSFTGKGTLIWGARTLAGMDNEWRYIAVRRFFNMAEESIKKATEQFVFEANDGNTWVRVRAMIENFLTLQWRAGALAGAKPEHAFYVRVGLGQTMTSQDILDGKMNVEIGLAVVRPAEFIVLKFSHKMQES